MKTKTLGPFLALTFGLSWGIDALLMLFTDKIIAIFGEIGLTNPLIILIVYSPGIAGVFLVWRHYGFQGLGSFFRRLTLWHAPLPWWLFLILGIPAIVYAGGALAAWLEHHAVRPPAENVALEEVLLPAQMRLGYLRAAPACQFVLRQGLEHTGGKERSMNILVLGQA